MWPQHLHSREEERRWQLPPQADPLRAAPNCFGMSFPFSWPNRANLDLGPKAPSHTEY